MFQWLQETDYAFWVQTSWGWPLALTLHAFGNAVIVGFIFIIGLRLFGLFRTIPIPSLRFLIPIMWVAFVVQVVSGTTLWVTKPDKYLSSDVFIAKLIFVLSGAIITFFFQQVLNREAETWQANGKVSSKGIRFVALACVAWALVLTMGRLTAYLGSLYS